MTKDTDVESLKDLPETPEDRPQVPGEQLLHPCPQCGRMRPPTADMQKRHRFIFCQCTGGSPCIK